MRWRGGLRWALFGALLVALAVAARATAADWPQLQNGPTRPGYSPEKLAPPFRPLWKTAFQPERVYPATQPIVYRGKIYIGTESGNLYALNANTGAKLWRFSAGGPILHTAGAAEGRVFFACMDGCVYAISAGDGKLLWRFDSGLDTGFSTAVALADGLVFALNRGGVAFALDQQRGRLVWRRELGVPLLQSPAYLPAQGARHGLLVFGAMDMRVYALDGGDGSLVWRSDRLYGQAFKDYWPVIHNGRVIVRSFIAYPKPRIAARTRWYWPDNFPLTWVDPNPLREWYPNEADWKLASEHGRWLREHSDAIARGELPELIIEAQKRLVAHYCAHPEDKDMFVLDINTGREAQVVPHWCAQTMNGATCPPCVDREGLLVVPIMFINSRWGRLDLKRGLVVDILYDGYTYSGQRVPEMRPGYAPIAGGGNTDENVIVSACDGLIFSFHCQESNANYTGVWSMDQRRWYSIAGMEWGELSHNTQGGGASAPVIANGLLYHMSFHSVRAWRPAARGGEER